MVLLSQATDANMQQFVYENLSFSGLTDYSKLFTSPYQRDHVSEDGTKLSDFISGIFSVYFGSGLRFDDSEDATPSAALVERGDTIFQLLDLKQHYTWLASEAISYVIAKTSGLKLSNLKVLNLYSHILKEDRSKVFFDRERERFFTQTIRQTPLKSLTPQQALQLIEVLFTVHPWAPFILNRTQILQQYFTESGDPLLLSVMFGVSKYFAKQMSEGNITSAAVRRGDTNEFLNYAHSILEETSAKPTLPKLQAVVLLSYFEITYGQAKKGTTLTALSYIMLSKLSGNGVNFKAANIAGLGSLQRELLRNAWWCIYTNTVCGTIEFGQVPREAITPRDVPFPHVGSHISESYQLDKSTGNTSMFISYSHIYESFYVAAVVCDTLAKIWLVLPEPDRNMFRTVPNLRQLANCPPTVKRPSVNEQILDILGDFEAFITAQLKHLSEQQIYQLQTTKDILFIHTHFLKEELDNREAMCYVSAVRSLYLNMDDYEIVTRIPSYSEPGENSPQLDRATIPDAVMDIVVPQAMEMIEKTAKFLDSREGKPELLQRAPAWLVLGALETSSVVLMLHIQQAENMSQAIHHLSIVLKLLRIKNLYTFPEDVKKLKNNIKQFMSRYVPNAKEERTNERIPTDEIRTFYPTPSPNASYENIFHQMSMGMDGTGAFDTETIATDEAVAASPLSFTNFTEPPEEMESGQFQFPVSSSMQADLLNLPSEFMETQYNDANNVMNSSMAGQPSHMVPPFSSPLDQDGDLNASGLNHLANIDATNLAMDFNLSAYDTDMLQQHISLSELQEIPLDLFVLDEQT